MRGWPQIQPVVTVAGAAIGLVAGLALAGCAGGGGGSPFGFFGSPFPTIHSGGTVGPGSSGQTPGGTGGGATGSTDPCNEPQRRKFVRITMRNASTDYVHYFLALIAFVNGPEFPGGAVCPSDIPLYTAFGYTSIPAGAAVEFGSFCIDGPALLYFHRGGQFRTAGGSGTTGLASAIAPAQGTTPTYDNFFGSAGATVPVPNVILFQNPGTGEGAALKISRSDPAPCSTSTAVNIDPACRQDAFYYVDQTDRLAGSTALGPGSGRRVGSEIQGTGCECLGINQPYQLLAPSDVSASDAVCDLFFRGGTINYVFVRNDTDPPFPQLVWRVTDSNGARAHDYDPDANIP